MAKPCQNNQRLTVQFKTFQNMSNSSWSLKFMQKQYLLSIIYIYIYMCNKQIQDENYNARGGGIRLFS